MKISIEQAINWVKNRKGGRGNYDKMGSILGRFLVGPYNAQQMTKD